MHRPAQVGQAVTDGEFSVKASRRFPCGLRQTSRDIDTDAQRGRTVKRFAAPAAQTGLTALAGLLVAWPAFAHHPLAGQEMTTFLHGLLSGIGHPLLGFDHLFFVVLVGVAAVFTGRALIAPLGYIGAMIVGCVLMTFGFALPGIETAIAGSLLVLGYVVLSGRALGLGPALGLFALAGLFHGAAFGESMAAAEASAATRVLIGYLIGLAALQYGICVLMGQVVAKVWKATESTAVQVRLAGAVVGGVGLFLSLEAVEGMAFSALGIG